MALRTIEYLKAKFLNGMKPPQTSFHDWLDSYLHLNDVGKYFQISLYFFELFDELPVPFENDTKVISVFYGNAVTVQYSLNGIDWVTFTSNITFSAGTFRWRVSNIGTYSDASIILKCEKV